MFTAATKPVIKPHWSRYQAGLARNTCVIQAGLARNTCVIPGYQTVITWQELLSKFWAYLTQVAANQVVAAIDLPRKMLSPIALEWGFWRGAVCP
jgi:hypothetical protein